ncbi:MAG TPA: AI-2E family transporter [Gemmatimonadaceae bacterium]|jgi:predicted PurR-regulated permease PerM|nr:AI-2E family transporter [Gemmatimonadaceae bacterium]
MTARPPAKEPDLTPGPGDARPSPEAPPAAPPGEIQPPNLDNIESAMEKQPAIRSMAAMLLVIIASFYTLYFARAFFLPVTFGLLLNLLLSPAVRAMKRARIPYPLGAAIVVLTIVAAVGLGGYFLSDPAQEWLTKAPQTVAAANVKIRKLRRPMEQASKSADQMARVAATGSTTPRVQEVTLAGPTLMDRFVETSAAFLAGALETLVLLYFLLASGDLFLQKLTKMLPEFKDKKKAVAIARETETSISMYLSTVALINVLEGGVVTLVMWALGMPNPVLWGVLVLFLEFVPYLGALVMVGVLTLAALSTFDNVPHIIAVPASYLAINLVQAYVVTPLLLGRRLTLNPVAILIGLILWWEVWGVAGAFIAVPLLATLKILCDHIETLAPVGEFLGD